MKKLAILLFVLLTTQQICEAQTNTIKGQITDKDKKSSIANAVIALLTPKDSFLYSFTRTDAAGNFILKNIANGQYVVMVTHPLFADLLYNADIDSTTKTLEEITLISKSKLLQEVIVKSGNPIKIKGDTTIYTADSFKVGANANVEELLKKLPGIQVDKNGKIKAMGESVEKVLVDGEEFFGDDPGMAVKNLRADAVKEVQVFDKKSDQAEFTGIDDGKTKKTINLKLKDDRKKGYFGKIELSGGLQKQIDNRYNNNVLLNAFKGKRKIAGYFLQGNVGQSGLDWQDRQKFGGNDDNTTMSFDEESGGMAIYSTRGSDEEPYVNTENGFFENINVGLQYSNKWKNKTTVNYSPKLNRTQYNNSLNRFSQFQLGNKIFNTTADENTFVRKQNVKNNLSYDANIDSSNSLKIIAKYNVFNSISTVFKQSNNVDENKLLNNSSNNITTNNNDKVSFNTSILFKHKFKKDRRTISLNADFSNQKSDGIIFINAINKLYNSGTAINIDSIDQKKNNSSNNNKISTKVLYTEPLSKKFALEFNYELAIVSGKNNLTTLTKMPGANSKYELPVDSLTNNFDQNIVTNKAGFRISFKNKKIKYGFGTAVGATTFDLKDLTINKNYKSDFTNIFPSANFQYNYKANHSFSINYNGNTGQPTINQLQNLRNNNDPLNIIIGNPFLKQSFSNRINIDHNSYNFVKEIWTYQGINFSNTLNAITNNTTIDNSGKTISQPINTNGNFNAGGWMGGGLKLKKLNLDLNLNTNFNVSRFSDIVNNVKNNNNNLSASLGVGLYKSKEKKYDFSINNDFGFNQNKSTISNKTITYNTNSLTLNAKVYYKKVWKLSTNFENNYRQKTSDFDKNVNNNLWSANIERTLHKDEFTIYFVVNDILNQNIGIDRTIYGNTLTETRNNRLQRYWMLGFKWDFKNKTAKK
jgi:Outer membrane protein beta-barrel family/Carboxypeptidase regulatory-like domain